jgi:spermidine synthase
MLGKIVSSFRFILKDDRSRLVQFSFLMLFVELTLIRWSAANIYYLFVFANFVLLASFLGMGIGFLRVQAARSYFNFSPIFLAIFIYICYRFSHEYHAVVNLQTDNLDYRMTYFKENLCPIWISLPLMFLTVTVLMATIADGLARAFQKFPALPAYRLEVLGSLLGILIFSALSFLHAGPLYWSIIISLLFASLLIQQWRSTNFLLIILQIAAISLIVGVFAKETSTPMHFWSPYSKIDVQEYSYNRYAVVVNGMPQQVIESVVQRERVKPFYVLPYQHAGKTHALNNVLIIGAGTGGDVAIALSQGAQHIDAVEIDPIIYKIGKKFNPDHPYSDPRVHVVINDGRAFLQQTRTKYDLIIFALTDSLYLLPGQSSLRLENYLYTQEALNTVKQDLAPAGVFAIYNYYGPRWMVDRLSNTITNVFQHAPCLDTFSEKDYWATVITVSENQTRLQCPARWQMQIKEFATPSTDDHPFLYLMNNRLPASNVLLLLFILFTTAFIFLRKVSKSYAAIKNHLDLFCMGAAFLLLETKSIINYALLFGTTWFVNALVFIGVLTTVYLAIEFTHRYTRLRTRTLCLLLFAALFLSWLVPNSFMLSLPYFLRFLLETVLAFSPIFVANLIFAERFRHTATSTEAFGVNLIGAVLGGLLEYCSLVVGFQSLLIVVALLYVAAIFFMHKGRFLKTFPAS